MPTYSIRVEAFGKYLALSVPLPHNFINEETEAQSNHFPKVTWLSQIHSQVLLFPTHNSILPSSCLSGSAETMLFLQETQVTSLLNPFTHTPHTYPQYTGMRDNPASFLQCYWVTSHLSPNFWNCQKKKLLDQSLTSIYQRKESWNIFPKLRSCSL